MIRLDDRNLRALAYRVLGDRDGMDDALQEGYLNAFRALPRAPASVTQVVRVT